ncbi:hypothetical protein ACWCOP_13230 [Maricaulaceae bacterium MS644]
MLEFIIVIAGVVIGFQIQAWTVDRAQRAEAEVMTARLLDDFRDEHWRVTGATVYYGQVSDNAMRAAGMLEGRGESDDEALVIAAFRATQTFGYPVIRATYEELVSTGDINLVADNVLRNLAVEYYETDLDVVRFQDPTRPYRFAFFRLIDRPLYEVLRADCAEPRDLEFGQYDRIPALLSGPCDLSGHEAAVSALATRLRASPELVGLLRQRANEALIEEGNNEYWRNRIETVGVTREPAP